MLLSKLGVRGITAGACLFTGLFAISSARAENYVLGMNFVVSHNTAISQVGVADGGNPLTSDETVAIFNDATGDLIGPDLLFGPGETAPGTQVGNTFYESVPLFVLTPGDYSIVSIGGTSPGGYTGGSDGNSGGDLGNTLDLPGGNRFNSGTSFGLGSGDVGSVLPSSSFGLIDPPDPVPDAGTTAILLGGAFTGLALLRRKI